MFSRVRIKSPTLVVSFCASIWLELRVEGIIKGEIEVSGASSTGSLREEGAHVAEIRRSDLFLLQFFLINSRR